jgi:hypothetical protein
VLDKEKVMELRDCRAEEITGVQIGAQGHKLWVCVDGQCILRVVSPKIQLEDNRPNDESCPVCANIADNLKRWNFEPGAPLTPLHQMLDMLRIIKALVTRKGENEEVDGDQWETLSNPGAL